MAGMIESKLTELGLTLPALAAPIANYVGFVRTGDLLFVSGQLCLGADGKLVAKGKLGAEVSIEDGQKAARACAVNLLAQIKAAVGDLDRVVRVVRLGGFISSVPSFLDGPKVMNGASDLMVTVFGDKGRHARTTIGVAGSPACRSMPPSRSRACSRWHDGRTAHPHPEGNGRYSGLGLGRLRQPEAGDRPA